MKVLLTRFGGIGDCFPVACAAEYLADQGNDVTIGLRDDGSNVKQSVLFSKQDKFKVLDLKEIGPWHDRCIKTDIGWKNIQAVYKDFDRVVDFMNVVENNSTCANNNTKDQWEFWQRSRNSNYQNWYDLHFSWCNIDPSIVPDNYKRPKMVLSDDEKARAAKFKDKHPTLFVIHPFASSLARSWYQAKELIPLLLRDYPSCAIAYWNPNENNWDLLTRRGPSKLQKLDENPLRETMILLSVADLVVCVDTGCSHIAEGLGSKSLTLYSTVPAWTRSKYYVHQNYIDPGKNNPEYYTFSLTLGDPLRVKDGFETLSERERQVVALMEANASIDEAMEVLNTDARGAELELKGLIGKKESWERQQSKALSSITPEAVFKRIKEIV